MSNKNWWQSAVGYQVYLKSFKDSNNDGMGDITGLADKLEYIKNLGVDFVWVSPFYQSPMDDNGYDVSDYTQVCEQYGSLKDVENLIERAHTLGLKIIIDLVLNHTSSEHGWFLKSVARATGYEDFYYWQDGVKTADGTLKEPNNWESIFGGSAWAYDPRRKQYYLRVFSATMPDINYNSEKAVSEMQNVIEWWANKGVDGFRVDAVSHIGKDQSFKNGAVGKTIKKFSNLKNTHEHLKKLSAKWNELGLVSMGELGGNPTLKDMLNYSLPQNNELNMVFTFEHLNCKCKKNGAQTDVNKIIKALKHKQRLATNGGWPVLFWTNHDYQRVASMYGSVKALSKSCSSLATAMYLLQGTPIIYNGEEIGMTNYPFKEIAELEDVNAKMLLNLAKTEEEKQEVFNRLKNETRDNARTIMQWNGSINAGFSEEKPWFVVNPNYHSVNVAVEQVEEHSVLNEYKRIIKLRKEDVDAFCFGSVKFKSCVNGVVRYVRSSCTHEYEVLANLTDEVKKFLLPVGEIVYTNYGEVVRGELSPYEAVVLRRNIITEK